MRVPRATYRLQFTPDFGFSAASELIPYLSDLGVSDLYASPILQARKGSMHGYDVIDTGEINTEYGGRDGFRLLATALRRAGVHWLQDIVPNHMAFDGSNRKLMDLLENGQASRYHSFFDIEWNHPDEGIRGRVLAPFLGKLYGECLEDGEIRLQFGEQGFTVAFYNQQFPLRIDSYPTLLTHGFGRLRRTMGRESSDFIKFLGVLYALKNFSSDDEKEEREDQLLFVKRMLWELFTRNSDIREHIGAILREFNGEQGSPESFNALDRLLLAQRYKLAFWQVATAEINYRRFFTINDLIAVRVEQEQVLEETHALLFQLVEEGYLSGLRIDHIDGLYDPTTYLHRLRRRCPDCYIVAEKILESGGGEELPDFWPLQGTTGYDFLNTANGLFCDRRAEKQFEKLYREFTGLQTPFHRLVANAKRAMVGRHMAGDVDQLAHLIKHISSKDRHGSDITLHGLRRALVEVLTHFPVYRTYISPGQFRAEDRATVQTAIKSAMESLPALFYELSFIERFLLLEFDEKLPPSGKDQWIHFVMRFQQFSGPLMAKGFEDTALYMFNRLLSLNEVGGNPGKFGLSPFDVHQFCRKRRSRWPHAMNATATHDTKRGEDVRARINVLSEIPAEWERKIRQWNKMNASRKTLGSGGDEMPDANDEYFLYQTLIGTYPFGAAGGPPPPAYVERVKATLLKSIKEAKVHTEYIAPNEEYERAALAFAGQLLGPSEDNPFLSDFLPFQAKVASYGILNSLGQLLLKLSAPGVPDLYQGTEFWDLSMVDPDNRRPPDFASRRRALAALQAREREDLPALLADLVGHPSDPAIKLFLLYRGLAFRREHPVLFETGDYLPLRVSGERGESIFAFVRRGEKECSLTVVPRLVTSFIKPEQMPPLGPLWADAAIDLSPVLEKRPREWTNQFSGKLLRGEDSLRVADILEDFPVGLLFGSLHAGGGGA